MRTRNNQKGAMIVLMAIAMPVLLGGMGLVVDNGILYDLKRRTQGAADASAIAAAQEIRLSNDNDVDSSATRDAELNGFVDGGDTEVIINRPPAAGPHAGDNGFVEVVVRERAPLFFMAAINDTRHVVQGRAVAGIVAAYRSGTHRRSFQRSTLPEVRTSLRCHERVLRVSSDHQTGRLLRRHRFRLASRRDDERRRRAASLRSHHEIHERDAVLRRSRRRRRRRRDRVNGNADVDLVGAMYFKNTGLHLSGTFDGLGNKMAIAAKNIEVNGNVDFEKFNLDFLPPSMAYARIVE